MPVKKAPGIKVTCFKGPLYPHNTHIIHSYPWQTFMFLVKKGLLNEAHADEENKIFHKNTALRPVFLTSIYLFSQLRTLDICSVIFGLTFCPIVNSLGPNDDIWRQRYESTLAQVMACCLTATSHYLNQCWLIISKIQLHSSDGNLHQSSMTKINMKFTHLKCH